MQKPLKQPTPIFETQPIASSLPHSQTLAQLKSYTQNLTHTIQKAFISQSKALKRKRLELEKQLQELRQKFFAERSKIFEMEEQFKRKCENVIKDDMKKWQDHQDFFYKMLEHYQYEVQIQSTINQRYREKVALLKQELKESMKQGVKWLVTNRLEQKESLQKSKRFRSKKALSTKSQIKLTPYKLKTQASEYTRPTEINDEFQQNAKSKRQKLHTLGDEPDYLPLVSQKHTRLKTDMSLPSLKKSNLISLQKIQNDEFNFMKPIRTVKKSQQQQSIIPEIIKLFEWQRTKLQFGETEADWFEKVVFNKRNFQRIMGHFKSEFETTINKKKYPQSGNKVKELVAKNLFRLKTESSITKNRSRIELKERSLLSIIDKKQPLSQQFIK